MANWRRTQTLLNGLRFLKGSHSRHAQLRGEGAWELNRRPRAPKRPRAPSKQQTQAFMRRFDFHSRERAHRIRGTKSEKGGALVVAKSPRMCTHLSNRLTHTGRTRVRFPKGVSPIDEGGRDGKCSLLLIIIG